MTAPSVSENAFTVVVSTYNRPAALMHAIGSVQLQTEKSWVMLVIGDHCDPETGAMIEGLRDPRIRYINLPLRSGEQTTPNSVGLSVARTPYVAFLNHDDVWFPDHLQTAKGALDSGADFFAGRAAFAFDPEEDDHQTAPAFTEASPPGRTYSQAFAGPFFLFEPISAWAVRREAALKVGRFRPGAIVYRSPLQDWVLRAWRAGLSLSASAPITVLKNNARIVRGHTARSYDYEVNGLEDWVAEIAAGRAEALRKRVEDEIIRNSHRARSLQSCFAFLPDLDAALMPALTQQAAEIYLRTGEDPVGRICEEAGYGAGWLMRMVLQSRTGEALPPPPALRDMVIFARQALARGASA